jgi:hypothetical protein
MNESDGMIRLHYQLMYKFVDRPVSEVLWREGRNQSHE